MFSIPDQSTSSETRLAMFGALYDIRDKGLRSSRIALLYEELRTKTALRELDLGFNQLTEDELSEITLTLRENHALKILDLRSNCISCESASRVIQNLLFNTSLTILGLSCNSIKDQGALAIADLLASNRSLKVLDLSWNPKIQKVGGSRLAKLLQESPSLENILLYSNHIGSSAAIELTKGLLSKTSTSSIRFD